MSTIYLPDPHPGRCKNWRRVGVETLRCLDYEGTEHVCSFPPTTYQFNSAWNSTTYVAAKPEPWVKP